MPPSVVSIQDWISFGRKPYHSRIEPAVFGAISQGGMGHIIERIHSGEGTANDVELLDSVAKQIQNKCLCALGEFSIQAVMTSIERFPKDFEA